MFFHYAIFVILLRVSNTLAALDEDLVKYLTDMEDRMEKRASKREDRIEKRASQRATAMKSFIAEQIEYATKELGKYSSNFTF